VAVAVPSLMVDMPLAHQDLEFHPLNRYY